MGVALRPASHTFLLILLPCVLPSKGVFRTRGSQELEAQKLLEAFGAAATQAGEHAAATAETIHAFKLPPNAGSVHGDTSKDLYQAFGAIGELAASAAKTLRALGSAVSGAGNRPGGAAELLQSLGASVADAGKRSDASASAKVIDHLGSAITKIGERTAVGPGSHARTSMLENTKDPMDLMRALGAAVADGDGHKVHHLTEALRSAFPSSAPEVAMAPCLLSAQPEQQVEPLPAVFDDEVFKLTREQKEELRAELQEPSVARSLARAQIGGWHSCATEGQQCKCVGKVRYGHSISNRWNDPGPASSNGDISCSSWRFGGDPAPGLKKECECQRSVFSLVKQGDSKSLLQEAFIFMLRFLGTVDVEHQVKERQLSMLPFTGHRAYNGIALWVHRQLNKPLAPEEVLERFWVDRYVHESVQHVHGPTCLEWDHDFGYINRIPQCTEKFSIEYKEGTMEVSGHELHGDIYKLPDAKLQFDLIVATQVLEHIEHPDNATKAIFDAVKPGGAVLYTGPHISQFHKVPVDYNRYTRERVVSMLRGAGFCVSLDQVAGGGDFLFAAAAFMGMRRSDFTLEEMQAGFHQGYHTISDGALGIYALGFKPPHQACSIREDYSQYVLRPPG